MSGLTEQPIDRASSLEMKCPRLVKIKATNPIEIDWNKFPEFEEVEDYDCRGQNSRSQSEAVRTRSLSKQASSKQIQHYGLDRSAKKMVNGAIIQDSRQGTQSDPLTCWQDQSIPSFYQAMCCLSLESTYESLELLESIGYDSDFLEKHDVGSRISARQLLSNHPYAFSENGILWEQLPRIVLITPKVCLASAIVCSLFPAKHDDPQVVQFLRHLVWAKQPSPKIRIGVDLYYTVSSAKFSTEKIRPIAKNRVIGDAKRVAASRKTRYVEASNETARQLNESRLNYSTRYIFGTVEIVLAPSNNRGKHICTVKAIDLVSGRILPLGTVRQHKGKLFYAYTDVLASQADRDAMKASLDQRSYSQEKFNTERDRLKSEITAKNAVIVELKAKVKTIKDLNVMKRLEVERVALKSLHSDLKSLSTPSSVESVRQNLQKFDQDMLAPIMNALSALGLQFNHWVRCIPSNSPLQSPKFWANEFGVLVRYDDDQIEANKPIEFIRDLRK